METNMPTQNPIAVPKSPSKWLKRVTYTDDLETKYLRCLVYGDPGCGKTRFVTGAPKPFVIDTDGGLLTVKDKHIPSITLGRGEETYKVVMELLLDMKLKRNGFGPHEELGNIESFIIDSLTKLGDLYMQDIMLHPVVGTGKNGSTPDVKNPGDIKPEWDHYSLVKERLNRTVDLAKELPLHFAATAWVDYERAKETGTPIKARPNIVGGYKEVAGGNFDAFFYMEDRGGADIKKRYILRTTKYGIYQSKTRLALPDIIEDPTFEGILKAVGK